MNHWSPRLKDPRLDVITGKCNIPWQFYNYCKPSQKPCELFSQFSLYYSKCRRGIPHIMGCFFKSHGTERTARPCIPAHASASLCLDGLLSDAWSGGTTGRWKTRGDEKPLRQEGKSLEWNWMMKMSVRRRRRREAESSQKWENEIKARRVDRDQAMCERRLKKKICEWVRDWLIVQVCSKKGKTANIRKDYMEN